MAAFPAALLSPRARIDAYLERVVALMDAPESLREAIGYALLSEGKRVRPALAWHACVCAGGTGDDSLPGGAAIELVHCFSLVHDDLPAMDDDDLRRGRPTLHVARGEAMAILAGDAMLTHAFGLLAGEVGDPGRSAAACRVLAEGTGRMIGGQVYDTLGGLPESLDDRARLETIHAGKTGALLEASCRIGAVLGSAEAVGGESGGGEAAERLGAFGRTVGLVFQIVDDLLDVEKSAEEIGKKTGKDAAAGKLTYPGVMGVEAARREAERLSDDAVALLGSFGPEADPLRELAAWLVVRDR